MIIAVTNCIAYGLNIDTDRLYRKKIHHSLFTEGLLQVLKGKAVYPKGADEERYRFDSIDINEVEAIIWSPFIDQAGYYPNQCTWNREIYPYNDELSAPKYGLVGHASLETVYLWWKELDRITKTIPKRVMVIYPSTFLSKSDSSLGIRQWYVDRIKESDKVALEIFKDWKIVTIENPVLDESKAWQHFNHECRKPMLAEIENYING